MARACGLRALQAAKMGGGSERTGIMDRDKGSFGFIRQDGWEEDMFVMPAACTAFGGVLPPLKSPVKYFVVTDPKTGRPRAEDVKPATNGVSLRAGTMNRGRGRFGFIRQDIGGEDMFVMPASCSAFGGCLPPAGTRVVYSVVPDEKTGLPRAEEVRPEVPTVASPLVQCAGGGFAVHSLQNTTLPALPALAAPAQAVPHAAAGDRRYGSFERDRGNYGFIRQDSGEDDMFCMPAAFGGAFPPAGTRVMYEVVTDPKTGRPRAEMVRTLAPERTAWRSRAPSQDVGASLGKHEPQRIGPRFPRSHSANGVYSGTMDRGKSNYGFIKQDSSDEDMFVLPLQCKAFGDCLPPLGTRVVYTVAPDPKTGRPSAQNVLPEAHAEIEHTSTPDSTSGRPVQRLSGAMDRDKGSFGFIKQDSSEEDMFVLPTSCVVFGGRFPATGTRVTYRVMQDSKTGRPRAEEVEPEDDLLSVMLAATGTNTEASTEDDLALAANSDDNMENVEYEQEDTTAEEAPKAPDDLEAIFQDGFLEADEADEAFEEEDEELYEAMQNGSEETGLVRDRSEYAGTIDRLKGSYGFIRQDGGGPDMFAMPNSCVVFGGTLPAIGTRVVYCVVTDPKTGRPRAEDVRPEAAAIPAAAALDMSERTGLMDRIKNGYGFIKQDSGEEDMFVMPGCCLAFGGAFPAPGTRVLYDVVTDPRTGRPRAGTVRPAPGGYGPATTRTARAGGGMSTGGTAAGPRIRPGPYS